MGSTKENRGNPLEAVIKKACTDYLDILENQGKLYYIRNNSFAGTIVRGNGTRGFIKNNKKGTADVIVFPGHSRALWCEFKRPLASKQSPDQVKFEKLIKGLGYEYYIIRSLDDLIGVL